MVYEISTFSHYSFDLWLTLIKSNPEFKTERTKVFHRDFNAGKKSIDEVAKAFRDVDLMCNAINQHTGKNIDSDEMYLMVISLINDNDFDLAIIDIIRLYDDMEALLFNYPPVLYAAETMDVLSHLKQKSGSTFSILSNTGFIKGVTLRKILKGLNMAEYFDFQLYSDECDMSKPNLQLFKLMIEKIWQQNPAKDVSLKNIIHIGDNPIADIAGADACGIKSCLINSNNVSISSLLNSW